MKVGICIPNTHATLAEPETMVGAARLAEASGFASLWVNDHVVVPSAEIETSADRQPQYLDRREQKIFEPTVLLAYLAACTQRIMLGTSVYVLALRNPVIAAKQIATLDVLSNGRVILGVGVGWMEAEFQAVGVPWSERGHRTDIGLRVAKALWRGGTVEVEGFDDRFDGIVFNPPPLQVPHPAIWIGGRSAAGARRAATLGDAWHPSHLTLAELRTSRARLDELCEAAGRATDDVAVTTRRRVVPRGRPTEPPEERRTLQGGPQEILEDLAALDDAGVTHIVLEVDSTSAAGLHDEIEWLGAEVLRSMPTEAPSPTVTRPDLAACDVSHG